MLHTLTDNINLYRSIFENNTSGIAIHDINLNIIEVNSAFCRLLGYTEGELLNLNITNLTPEEDIPRIHKNVEHFKSGRQNSIKINRPYIQKNGSLLYVNTDVNIVRDSIGHVEFFILSIRDNRKYKLTHQALLQTGKRYQILFENSLDGISIWDNKGKLIEANPSFCHLLGYQEDELLKKNIMQITAPEDIEMTQLFGRQLRSREVPSFSRKKRFLTKQGGVILCNVSVRGIYDNENNYAGAVASVRNITESVKQERIIWKLNKVMQKSGRAYARLEGAVHIASENLQTQIHNFTDFTQKIISDTSQQQFIETLKDKALAINTTLENLLTYTRIQSQNIKTQETNMQELFEDVLSNFNTIKPNANITVQGLPTSIEMDQDKISQLLHQLIHNALKFCPTNTCPTIHIKAEEKIDHWAYSVSDNGIGIPKDDRYHIFLPFMQLDTAAEGAGMGLAICKTIIEQHQGKIYIASEPEDGHATTIYFSIPKNIA